ncbi:MAG: CsgG/HfaB family protein [Treponema sp.]|jgi:hypothetical protein|nr:CsgG/HfaB family protein [Treponema sp.]
MKRTIIFCITILGITALHANPNLTGAWTATIEYNRSFDVYRISLAADGRCTVKVTNDNAEQETAGNWSWDGAFFRLNATFRNAKIAYLPHVQWSSVLNFSTDNNSFTILGKTATNGSQARITFFRSDDSLDITFNDKAAPSIFAALSKNIPLRSRLAVVGVTAADPTEAAFYVNELTVQFVNAQKYTVVDRTNVDAVLTEQNFQMSGYADDDAVVSVGKFIGATVVITGSIDGTGSQKRLVIKAIDVLTSEILSMVSVAL